MTVHSRSAWGANAPKSVSRNISPTGVALHWVGPGMGPFSHSECARKVRNIQKFHQVDRGWADIAYSLLVCPHGDIYVGRGKGVRTAANGNDAGNKGYYAVCYLGGENDGFTDAGKRGMREALTVLGFGPKQATTHRKVRGGGTACPGSDIIGWVDAGCPVRAPSGAAKPSATAAGVPVTPTAATPVRKAHRMLVRFHNDPIYKDHVWEVVASRLEHVTADAYKARKIASGDIRLVEVTDPLYNLPKIEA